MLCENMNCNAGQHEAKQAFEPDTRCPGGGLGTDDSSEGASEGKPVNLIPFDIAFLEMYQGTAYGGEKNDGKAGTESSVNNDVVMEANDFKNQ